MLAVAVHLVTVAIVAVGVWLTWEAQQVPIVGVLALFCFLMAYALRPRLGRLPRKAMILSRASHAMTFQLLDHLAQLVRGPTFDWIVLNHDPNAATGQVGLRRKRVLYIGAPLWSVLDWEERLALLAHELGHNVNNDVRRRYFLATAMTALSVWIDVLTPRTRIHNFMQVLIRTFARAPLRWLATITLKAQLRLSSGVSRLAEYRADDISAAVGGTQAALRTLDKMLIIGEQKERLTQIALYDPQADLWAAEKDYVDNFPARQRARLRKINELSASNVYSTHPTISRRISYLASENVSAIVKPLPAEELATIDQELAPELRKLGRDLRRQVRRNLTPAQLEALGQY